MRTVLVRLAALCLMLCMLLSCGCAAASEEIMIAGIQKYGNLVLSVSGSDFLRLGYTYGDILHVQLNGRIYEMPVGSSYSDVDEGSMICRVLIDPQSGEDYVILAVNMGDLATQAGIATKTKVEEEPGYRWDWLVPQPVQVCFSMQEAGGYLNEYLLRRLVRTNERGDYLHLTDEQFANFRAVATTGMGDAVLYRSSSPVNPELGRNLYADQALEKAGIRTIVNLADSQTEMQSYAGFAQSAYAQCNVIPLALGVDFMAQDFKAGLAEGLRFLLQHEGPYLVHCTEGKDRAGFVSALLECLMGASIEEVAADYMTTYIQYYGVEAGTEQYSVIAERNIVHTLQSAFDAEKLEEVNLAEEAEHYLLEEIRLTAEEITQLRQCLSGR